MNLEKVKKILLITSISAVGASALLLILQVLGVPIFQGVMLRILLIVATIGATSGIALNEIAVIKRKKILGYVSLGLLGLSTAFAIVIFCSNILTTGGVFPKITGVTALVSILFIIIVSLYSKMENHLIGLQIPAYVSLSLVDATLVLLVVGINVFAVKGLLEAFIIMCIVSVALIITVSVISAKRNASPEVQKAKNDEYVTISKKEYENLIAENKELKEKLDRFENVEE